MVEWVVSLSLFALRSLPFALRPLLLESVLSAQSAVKFSVAAEARNLSHRSLLSRRSRAEEDGGGGSAVPFRLCGGGNAKKRNARRSFLTAAHFI
jgi:hypothetical protein